MEWVRGRGGAVGREEEQEERGEATGGAGSLAASREAWGPGDVGGSATD